MAAQETFETLRNQTAVGEQTEHEVFLGAGAGAGAVTAEANSLRTAHNCLTRLFKMRRLRPVNSIHQRAADVIALMEREESATKISELEGEIWS